jgi:hypothetical protein
LRFQKDFHGSEQQNQQQFEQLPSYGNFFRQQKAPSYPQSNSGLGHHQEDGTSDWIRQLFNVSREREVVAIYMQLLKSVGTMITIPSITGIGGMDDCSRDCISHTE